MSAHFNTSYNGQSIQCSDNVTIFVQSLLASSLCFKYVHICIPIYLSRFVSTGVSCRNKRQELFISSVLYLYIKILKCTSCFFVHALLYSTWKTELGYNFLKRIHLDQLITPEITCMLNFMKIIGAISEIRFYICKNCSFKSIRLLCLYISCHLKIIPIHIFPIILWVDMKIFKCRAI